MHRRSSILVAIVGLGMSLAGPLAAPAAHAAEPLTVTAKLVEIPAKFPPDDLYDYAFVMRYEVVGGPMDKQSILVAHYKPRQPRSKIKPPMKAHVGGKLRSFVQGDVHKLKLDPALKTIFTGALIDEFAATDRKSPRYWCLEADPG
jgi:hypothetical protein